MIQILLGKWIAKKGGVAALLFVGDLITKVTKSLKKINCVKIKCVKIKF